MNCNQTDLLTKLDKTDYLLYYNVKNQNGEMND